ncbi:MAG: acyl-CoA dehydrogenase C-terminal domain-containing protein [Gluconacetobacter sp.]
MQTYTPPLRDMKFVLTELHDFSRLTALEAFSEVDADLAETVLEEGGKFTSEVLLPLNMSGDREGCRLENGVVTTPHGFRDAYRQFCEGGWSALSAPPEYGGQGLPETIGMMLSEMICATNLSFGLYPGLTGGAMVALRKYGSEELKAQYLPKMISGEWSGSMCLTEAHCGTDLGLLRTKAVPQEDGTYRLSGSKIFISAGEHDLSENIIHLVLARLADAPAGIKGISLFLVPKFLLRDDGTPGERNGVLCTGIEHKMGIKASATCQLAFDDAKGWLVGAPHKGIQAMFAMMNAERLGVGIQGLGIAEVAYQSAVAYAKERLQGRSLAGAKYPALPADPIVVHPDVRRMLMTMRVNAEGCRALGAWVAMALDVAEHGGDERERRDAEDFVALMTPVVKAMFTDLGFESANLAMQTYGGHGYIADHGVEQFVRDSRIAMIYEGTNGIQALDLVGRKLPAHMGRNLRGLFHPIAAFIAENKENPLLGEMVIGLERAFGALQLATGQIAERGMKDPEEAGAAATDYLRLIGLVSLAYLWARTVAIAVPKSFAAGPDQAFYSTKIASARFFYDRVLPESASLYLKIKAGKASMMALADDAF